MSPKGGRSRDPPPCRPGVAALRLVLGGYTLSKGSPAACIAMQGLNWEQGVQRFAPDHASQDVEGRGFGAGETGAHSFAVCAQSNTVLGVVASAAYGPSLVRFARSAHIAGFPCVATQPLGNFAELHAPLVHTLPPPPGLLLPESQWCDQNWLHPKYNWRRQMMYKMHMIQTILRIGHDVLCHDLDYELTHSPLPYLVSLEMAVSCTRSPGPELEHKLCRRQADVVAMYDGIKFKQLNMGSLWIRNTARTRVLAARVAARTWLTGEQLSLNEELNFNRAFLGIGCCHTRCFRASAHKVPEALDHGRRGEAIRRRAEPEPLRCEARQPRAGLGPPNGTRLKWNHATSAPTNMGKSVVRMIPRKVRGWDNASFNWLAPSSMKFGRCTYPDNVCALAAGTSAVDTSGWANCSVREVERLNSTYTQPLLSKRRNKLARRHAVPQVL